MFTAQSPSGRPMEVPENPSEDEASFTLEQTSPAASSLAELGYVVMRDVIPSQLCDEFRAEFALTVKPQKRILERTGGRWEKNNLNAHGFMTNAIMNIQNFRGRKFRRYQELQFAILTHANLQRFLHELLGARLRLITCNHFEANPTTFAHQDRYFFNGIAGDVFAVWVALEDISAKAGRLYLCPRTHRLEMAPLFNKHGIARAMVHPRESDYRALVKKLIDEDAVTCRAPCLRKGDLVIWNSRTIHGSLATSDPAHSRSSLTAHFVGIPSSEEAELEINGVAITRQRYPSLPRRVLSRVKGLIRRLKRQT